MFKRLLDMTLEVKDTKGPSPVPLSLLEKPLRSRSHALLLQSTQLNPLLEIALALAKAWLCERGRALYTPGCGQCKACHLLEVRTHPDFKLIAPEAWFIENHWPTDTQGATEREGKKQKPSKEIRIEALQTCIDFAQLTSIRGRSRVIVIHLAQTMNLVTANALLKTLEEPPGVTRFILTSNSIHQILPTIRSRCQTYNMVFPEPMVTKYNDIPKALLKGEVEVLQGLPPTEVTQLCLKICHDLWLQTVGGTPRFFSGDDLPPAPTAFALSDWHRMLLDMMKAVQQPLKENLFLEHLVMQSSRILNNKVS
jgi:DNA polymerase-3 subunit delta'